MSKVPLKSPSRTSQSISAGDLAEKTGTVLQGAPEIKISGAGAIQMAKPGDVTFVAEAKYKKHLNTTEASLVIVTAEDAKAISRIPALICDNPKFVFAQIVEWLYPFKEISPLLHPSAVIDPSAEIHPDTFIGAHVTIGEGVKVGPGVVIQPGCTLGDGCEIGEGTLLHSKVTIQHHCIVGRHCTIHTGAVIGSDGFGFVKQGERWIKVPQVGRVVIGDRVEIGANTTIDRGTINDTLIEDDVILDNQIQIGHNVQIGRGTAIAACCGIAGSAIIGKHCMIGGGTGVVGHITVADFVNVVAGSNIGQSIKKAGVYASGLTTTDMKTWKRNLVRHHQLDSLATRLIELERKIKAQEEAKACQ